MRRGRFSRFDPDEIPPEVVAAEDATPSTSAQEMREARDRLARRAEAKEAADKRLHEGQPGGYFEQRLAAARAAVAPTEPVAYGFVPRPGGFVITAITEEDLAVPISPQTPKV